MTPPLARHIPGITTAALKAHLLRPTPLHLGGLIAHWPALTKWRLDDGLQAVRNGVGEDREVDIEVGRKGRGYLDPEFQRISMGFGLFLDAFILGRIPSQDPESLPTAYLAQSDILDDSPLIADIPHLEHYTAGQRGEMYRRTLWIGPSGSFTPFHRDPYIGLYSQIIGQKVFHVLPPDSSAFLEPSTDPRHTNTSTISVPVSHLFYPNPNQSLSEDIPPRILDRCRVGLNKAFELDGACRVDLKAGESILIPEGWWHSAEGGEGSGVGVGAWFR